MYRTIQTDKLILLNFEKFSNLVCLFLSDDKLDDNNMKFLYRI